MHIFKHIDEAKDTLSKFPGTVVCIGNFDGCHLGHQHLMRHVIKTSKAAGYPSLALTFDPNPKIYFKPELAKTVIYTIDQKIRAFKEIGIDFTVVQPFNDEFQKIDPQEFTESLKRDLKCHSLFVGKNFKFGRDRAGDIDFLKTHQNLFKVEDIPVKPSEGCTISSTRIREAISSGNVAVAHKLLGRPYSILGKISQGQKLGRTIGFPTANLDPESPLIPKPGVYCGYMSLNESPTELTLDKSHLHQCVFNIGRNPTVGGDLPLSIEGHALDETWDFDYLYGKQCRFYLTQRIRSEIKFDSLEDLKGQIYKDCSSARDLLNQ